MNVSVASALVLQVWAALSLDAAGAATTRLTWVPGSTVRVTQIVGDCDYQLQAKSGQCNLTNSRTGTRSKVLGTDLGASFESQGNLIFLFGDSIGPSEDYLAQDTMASSTSTDPASLFVDFYTKTDGTPYFIKIPGVRLGAAEVPHAGIRLASGTYVAFNTGTDQALPDPNVNMYSVLTRFDEVNRRFTLLRTISSRPSGRFVTTALQAFGSDVLMWGLGAYRASDVYLATVPASTFATGQGTRYFTGLVNGQPAWSTSESAAVPVVVDGTAHKIGNVSVTFASDPGLWVMTYDTASTSQTTAGIYFTSAEDPWGPWSAPQLIFNAKRDGAMGTFMHDPSIVPDPPGDGLNGPTIGQNDPYKTRGSPYAPYIIERFTRREGGRLSIYYALSTWNPYTTVEMRSDFTITHPGPKRRSARH
jgi:hypothetical protein